MNGSLEILFLLSGIMLTIGYVTTFTPPKLGDSVIKNIENIKDNKLFKLDPDNILSHNETQGTCQPYSDPDTNIYDIKLKFVKYNILKILENDDYPIQTKLDIIKSFNDIIFENQNTDSTLFDDWNFDLF